MGVCNPAACGATTIIASPEICELQPRLKTLSKFGFYPCSNPLPDPLVAEAIEDMIETDVIVFSQELANIVLADPNFQDLVISDCRPPSQIVSTREITFQDRIAIEVSEGSPAIPNAWFDWDFWADKQEKTIVLNYLLQYCDGDTIIARDSNGNPLTASLTMWVNYDAPANPGGRKIEFKSGRIVFNGDPLALSNPPAFNVAADGTVTLIP